MKTTPGKLATANDSAPGLNEDLAEILSGLAAAEKLISPKYFYDQRGSELFAEICNLPEYYLTRTELQLLDECLDDVAERVGPRAAVIEFGAGSNIKIRKLLDHLIDPAAYVPVEISPDYLLEQSHDLARDYPNVHVQPVFADFTQPFDLPEHPIMPARNLVFFPGSTIGNFSRDQARDLLEVMRIEAGDGGALLIGVDLRKDPAVLHAAYNDSAGTTAAFNLNVLERLNRELGADFDLDRFEHSAVYDELSGRIEMRLVSLEAQVVDIAGRKIEFDRGEHIITEHSHKYSIDEFIALAQTASLRSERVWTDALDYFSLHYLTVD